MLRWVQKKIWHDDISGLTTCFSFQSGYLSWFNFSLKPHTSLDTDNADRDFIGSMVDFQKMSVDYDNITGFTYNKES